MRPSRRIVEKAGLRVVDQWADFPMELFLLMGDDYVADPALGPVCHNRRQRLELNLDPAVRRQFARSLVPLGMGPEQRRHRARARGCMNVLITSASRKVGLVRAFMEAVRTTGGGRVVAADITPLAPALYEADAGILIPRSDDPGFVDAVLAICERDGIGLVVPTRDEELPVFAAAKDRFATNGISVLVADPEPVAICQDKRRFAVACTAAVSATPQSGIESTDAGRSRRSSSGLDGARAGWARARCGRKPSLQVALDELGHEAFTQAPASARSSRSMCSWTRAAYRSRAASPAGARGRR